MNNIILIDGIAFDAETGKKVLQSADNRQLTREDAPKNQPKWHQQTVNYKNYAKPNRLQKAQTLNRDFVARPKIETAAKTTAPATIRRFERAIPVETAPQVAKRVAHNHELIGHFKPGDFNPTKQPIVISQKNLPDETLSAEELAKYKDRLAAARKINIQNRIRIARIQRQREREQGKIRVEIPQSLTTNQAEASRLLNQQPTQAETEALALRLAKESRDLKHNLINQALANAPSSAQAQTNHRQPTKRRQSSAGQRWSLAAAGLAMVLLIGYLTYLNLPQASLRIAANQAGVEASYPNYRPVGYSLAAPAKAENSRVAMTFANSAQNFTIFEQASNWDSEALLEQIIIPNSGGEFSTDSQNGLTFYSFANQTVWVNQGVLYTIENNSTLSDDQIRQIAISL